MESSAPVCPICGAEMVAQRVQCEDWSGWMYGWACECDVALREGYDGDEIVVWASYLPDPTKEETDAE